MVKYCMGKLFQHEENFWAKVDKNGPIPAHAPELSECWIWLGAKDRVLVTSKNS
jgi:hypothetical protein